jgi:hypothetical protein
MAIVFKVDSSTIAVPRDVILQRLVPFVRPSGTPTLSFAARGGALPVDADPYLGKECELVVDSTTRFKGDVVSVNVAFDARLGWIRQYQAHGLRARGDKVPVTDETLLTDVSPFNLRPEDPEYRAGRAGRTAGEIIADVLTMVANATALDAYGLGGYTSLSPPTLPSATTTDLASLTGPVPNSARIQGERLLSAIDAFLQENVPGWGLFVDPATGNLRFTVSGTIAAQSLAVGVDPIDLPTFARDTDGAFPRVVVRGQPIAVMGLFKLSEGGIDERFDHDSISNTAAKAAYDPADATRTDTYMDTGTCTCPDTTTVTVTSSDAAKAWGPDAWDQTGTGQHGTINLYSSVTTGFTVVWTARVTANTALAAGGTSDLTIDVPLPHLDYDSYTLTGSLRGESLVYRRYQLHDASLWPLAVAQSTYPQPFHNPGGGTSLVSTPVGYVLRSLAGAGPPYLLVEVPFTYDPETGFILFASSTYATANCSDPADVWVMLPINQGILQVASPADVSGVPQYAGTSNSVEGLEDTLTITVPEWRDPANSPAMQAYADNWHNAVKDTVVEGSVTYHGLWTPGLSSGPFTLTFDWSGAGYDAPMYFASSFPVVSEAEVTFMDGGTRFTTRARFSNRIGHYSAQQFLHPDRTGITWGSPDGGVQSFSEPTSFVRGAVGQAVGNALSGHDNGSFSIPTSVDDVLSEGME